MPIVLCFARVTCRDVFAVSDASAVVVSAVDVYVSASSLMCALPHTSVNYMSCLTFEAHTPKDV